MFNGTFLFIYIKFENPDLNMDKITGLFNQRAFITYVKPNDSNQTGILYCSNCL